jgi:hypothetical protein
VTDVTAQSSSTGATARTTPGRSRIKKVFPASHSNNEFPPFAAFLFAFLPASVVYVSVRFDHGTVRYGRVLSAVFPSHSASEALYIARWWSGLGFSLLSCSLHLYTYAYPVLVTYIPAFTSLFFGLSQSKLPDDLDSLGEYGFGTRKFIPSLVDRHCVIRGHSRL